jgi:hypothetical protein
MGVMMKKMPMKQMPKKLSATQAKTVRTKAKQMLGAAGAAY